MRGTAPYLVCAAVCAALPARAQCPSTPLGITVVGDPERRQYLATAKAEPLADTPEGRDIAVAEARLGARALLMRDPAVPKVDGRLRGVTEINECSADDFTFVTVRISDADIRRAKMVGEALKHSFEHSPTPH